jgi:imidazolonepropionase-like amidohydrolase
MRRLASSIAILLLCARTAGAQDVLVLRSATVIDGTSASPRERITILIRGERIAAVGPDDQVPIPPQATVLDATGQWVIPGLVEVHTHSTARPRLAQALALGVTSALVIAPSDSFLALGPWSAEPSSTAPRMFVTPGGFSGGFPEPFVQGFALERPASPSEARRAVEALTARGAKQFKIWHDDGSLWSDTVMRLPMLTPEVLTEIVRAAHQRKARVYAHAWRARDARAMLDAGVDAIIHPVADSILDPALLRRFAERRMATATTWSGLLRIFNRSAFARRVLADERLLRALPDSEAQAFARDTEPPVRTDPLWARLAGYRATVSRNARALLDAGAPLAVGSDGPVGLATHLEMELMVEGGLTPREVLLAATVGGARLLGLSREVGTIEPGKRADLVVLRSDPLTDIRNARDVVWTIKGGRPRRHTFPTSPTVQ